MPSNIQDQSGALDCQLVQPLIPPVPVQKALSHVAIVMDGNQRWAIQRGQPGPEGHRVGAKTVKKIVKAAARFGLHALTLFAFSSENWRRPPFEVELLMTLFCDALDEQVEELHKNNIRLRFIGDLTRFPQHLFLRMNASSELTAKNTGLQLNIAVNYGGQWDIFKAALEMAKKAVENPSLIDQFEEKDFVQHLELSDLPAVDLLIRTSGEQRISNFLLWQIAYAELYFTETLWPDFDVRAFKEAIRSYGNRERRFGQSSQELMSRSVE